jgi:hypothetical protein
MAELEKVIKGIECCLGSGNANACEPCPYKDECAKAVGESPSPLRRDALSLLKAQEAKPPRFAVAYDKIFYACDNCGKSLVVMANSEGLVLQKYVPKYCSECGQAVRWE